jgi:hypothetical protein
MRKSGLTGDEAYVLSKHGKTTEDLGPLKKEIGLLKEDLSNLSSSKISKFYATNNGENHLADSDDGKIADMMVYGKSEQKSTMGKNLLKLSEADAQDSVNGLLATMNTDGSISVTGTSTSNWSNITKLNNECHIDNATYTFSVDKNPDIVIGLKLGRTKLDDANYQTHKIRQNQLSCTFETGASNEYCSLFLEGLTVGKSYNFTIYPMLELGTEATAYEPYTGGQPSPSPDYPQEIKSVVNPTVKIVGKNLLNATLQTITLNGVTCINNGDGTYTLNGTPTVDTDFYIYGAFDTVNRLPLDSQKTYIVKKSGHSKIQFHVGKPGIYTTVAILEDGQIKNRATISFFICRILSGTILNNFTIYPQVEEGSASTDFQPYHEQTVTLPYTLNAIPVNSGGNVTINGQQYVADYVDVEREKLVRIVSPVAVTDSGDVREYNNSYQVLINKYIKNTTDNKIGMILCDKLRPASANDVWTGAADNIVSTHSGESNRITFRCATKANDKDSALKFIKSCKIYIVLAEPEEIDLTPEEIAAFKALATYYPVTNISINTEQLDGYTVFNYPISMANGWNYVKQQLNDNRDYIYDMDTKTQDIDTQAAEAYVNSEYAVALTELEV